MAKTHFKKLMNPNYLGSYSLEDGKDAVFTIKNVRQESVMGADGKKEDCLVCYFAESELPMILNATNAKMIAKVLGTPYIEEWQGHKIQIGIEKVRAFGDVVEALRVRKTLPKDTVIKCEECGKNITPSNGMSVEQLAAYTKDRYGKALCAKCATAQAQKAKQTDETEQEELL